MFHLGFPFFIASTACYFLPTIIGAARHKSNLVGIFLVNFFLGWSVIGWIVALVWSLSTDRVYQAPVPQQAWTPPPPRAGFCPSCGSQGQTGRFCSHCGAALS